MPSSLARVARATLTVAAVAVPTAHAQLPTQAPPLGPAPSVRFPAVQQATLPNGLMLYVVPMREVPLVQATLSVEGGGRDDGQVPGLATFMADMLDEGADTLDAFGVAAQVEYLGARLSTSADWDRTFVSLSTPRRTVDEALQLMAAVALRPTFRASDIRRNRDLRLARILQARDQGPQVAATVAAAVLYPAAHPYHHPLGGDSLATLALDSATVRAFWQRSMRPDRARLVLVGDLTLAEARAWAAAHFGGWKAAAGVPGLPARRTVEVPAPAARLVLVDKPQAAQSSIILTRTGLPRGTPDYLAIQVMNTILGGSFSSRLNTVLRETKGWTYGAGSGFTWAPLPGPFRIRSEIRTDVTDSALAVVRAELARLRDSLVAPAELARARNYLALGLADAFETTGQVAAEVENLLALGLPLTYYDGYVARVQAISAEQVRAAARRYLDPAGLISVVVGDLAKVRASVEAVGLGPSELRTVTGAPVP